MAPTMIDLKPGQTVKLPTKDSYCDTSTIDLDEIHVRVWCRYTRRVETLGFSVTPAGRSNRQEPNGPMVPGPFGSTWATPTVIALYPDSAPSTVINAEEGSRFELGSQVYELRDNRPMNYPGLVAVECGQCGCTADGR